MNTSDFIRPPHAGRRKRTLNFEALYELSLPVDGLNADNNRHLLEKAYAAQRRGYVLTVSENNK